MVILVDYLGSPRSYGPSSAVLLGSLNHPEAEVIGEPHSQELFLNQSGGFLNEKSVQSAKYSSTNGVIRNSEQLRVVSYGDRTYLELWGYQTFADIFFGQEIHDKWVTNTYEDYWEEIHLSVTQLSRFLYVYQTVTFDSNDGNFNDNMWAYRTVQVFFYDYTNRPYEIGFHREHTDKVYRRCPFPPFPSEVEIFKPATGIAYRWLFHTAVEFTPDFVSVSQAKSQLIESGNWTSGHLGKLSAEAIKSVDTFSGNGIALMHDLISIGELARGNLSSLEEIAHSYLKSIRAMKNSSGRVRSLKNAYHQMAREASSLYLSNHYGWKLTVNDVNDLLNSLNQYGKKSVNFAQTSTIDITSTLRIITSLNLPLSPISALRDLMDINLNLSNTWDLIPYSFVVDWFISVGDMADQISNFEKLESRQILGSTVSTKCQRTISRGDFGNTVLTTFERMALKNYIPIPQIELRTVASINPKRFIEGGTLYVSKTH